MTVEIKVVSLAGSTTRRTKMAEQLRDLDVNWSFFDACSSIPADLSYSPADTRRRHGFELAPGELGCFASHFMLWRRLVDDCSAKAYCILEDDVLLDPSFFAKTAEFPAAFADLDLVRLYAKVPAPFTYMRMALGRHLVHYRRPIWGTQGYYVTKAGAQRMLRATPAVMRPIDDHMDRFWENGAPLIGLTPFPLIEVTMGSTIQSRWQPASLSATDATARLAHRSWDKVRRIAFGALQQTPR